MIETAKIMAKGQLTIPKQIRDSLGLEPGDQVGVKTEGGKIIIEKNTTLELAQKLQALLEATPAASDTDILKLIKDSRETPPDTPAPQTRFQVPTHISLEELLAQPRPANPGPLTLDEVENTAFYAELQALR